MYKRQAIDIAQLGQQLGEVALLIDVQPVVREVLSDEYQLCLLYTSDAADERSSVDLGGRRIIKKKI